MNRKLNRPLALLLALAMVLSLMSTGAWAAEVEPAGPEALSETEQAPEPEEPAEAEVTPEPEEVTEPEEVSEPEEVTEPETVPEPEVISEPEEVTEPEEVPEPEAIPEPEAVPEPETVTEPEELPETVVEDTASAEAAAETLEPHTHSDGENTITFEPWESADSLPKSGNWYLTDNVTVSDTTNLNFSNPNLNLCLNGKKITAQDYAYVLNGGTMKLFDESEGGGSITSSANYVLAGNNGASFTLYGGTLESTSGGVAVINVYGGSVTLDGATLKGDATGIDALQASVNVKSGTIDVGGNGIVVSGSGSYTVNGGTIKAGGVALATANGGFLTVNGGFFSGTLAGETWANNPSFSFPTITVNGGWFSEEPDLTAEKCNISMGLGKGIGPSSEYEDYPYTVLPKATPQMFNLTTPDQPPVADGTDKSSTVTASLKEDYVGKVGEITGISFYQGRTLVDAPTEPGVYQIALNVANGTDYLGGTISDLSWQLTIAYRYAYSNDFENGDDELTIVDADNDWETWGLGSINYYDSEAHSGEDFLISPSYWGGSSDDGADNWAILPPVMLTDTSELSFWAASMDGVYPGNLGIFIGQSPDITAMTQLGEKLTPPGYDYDAGPDHGYEHYTVELGDYAGQVRYIAFRQYGSNEQDRILLDDVEITSPHTHSFSYNGSGNTITAKCNTPYCELKEGLTLTLSAPANLVYDGQSKNAALNTDYSREAFPKSTYTIVYRRDSDNYLISTDSGPSAAGTYNAQVTVDGAKATVRFTVTPKTVTVRGIAVEDKQYDGTANAALNTDSAVVVGLVGNDAVGVSGSGTFADANAGQNKTVNLTSLTLTGAQAGNYSLDTLNSQSTARATILPRPLTITAQDKESVFGQPLAELTYTADGAVQGDELGIQVSSTVTAVSPAGTYPITVTWNQNGNYTATVTNAVYTVTKAETGAVVRGVDCTYDGQSHSILVAPADDGCTVYYSTVSAADALAGRNPTNPGYRDVGEYTVYYAIVSDSYDTGTLQGSATVKIAPAEVELNWTNTALVYNGAPQAPSATATGLFGEDVCAVTVQGAETNASAYTATATGLSNPNYKLPEAKTTSFTIDPAPLTVTADDKSGPYRSEPAPLTYQVSGQVYGDDSLTFAASCAVTSASPAKTYPISVGWDGAENTNYAVTFAGGTYTVTEAPAYVTATAYTGEYDAQAHGITVTVKTGNNPEAVSLSDTEAAVYYSTESAEQAQRERNTQCPTFTDQGTYTVYYFVELSNYLVDSVGSLDAVSGSKSVTITPKQILVAADSQSKPFGAEDPALTYQSDPLLEGDRFTGALARASGEDVGAYDITLGTLSAGANYNIRFVGNQFEIRAGSVGKVTPPTGLSATYSGQPQALAKPGSVEHGALVYSLDADGAYTAEIPTAVDAGTYVIFYKVDGQGGYADTPSGAVKAEIAPKTIGLKWSGTAFTYDGKSHVPTATATGLAAGDTCNLTVLGAQTNAGTYTATAIGLDGPNYVLPEQCAQRFTIAKAAQKAPKAPVVTKVTGSSIAVKAVKGQEYRISGSAKWQTGGTFKGLTPGKQYTIVTRKTADANHKVSPASAGTKARTLTAAMLMQGGAQVSVKNGAVNVKVGKVPGATAYDIYVQYCGQSFAKEPTLTTAKTSVKLTKLTGKALAQNQNVKVMVAARNGDKVLGKTKVLHAVNQKGVSDPTDLSVKKTALTLKQGKSASLGAAVTPKTGLLPADHDPVLRYVTSDSAVATVSSTGKVTAKRPGVCVVQVFTINGLSRNVTVTVK